MKSLSQTFKLWALRLVSRSGAANGSDGHAKTTIEAEISVTSAPEETVEVVVQQGEGFWAAAGTHRGRKRAGNEDSFACDAERGVFVVADGMGGHAAGEQASALVVQSLMTELTSVLGTQESKAEAETRQDLSGALQRAGALVLQEAETHPEWKGMGSTAVVALLRCEDDKWSLDIANVGDSRAYLVREDNATALTRDHSMVSLMVEKGMIKPEEVRHHPARNSLTMALGLEGEIAPFTVLQSLQKGDRVLLCSDGLWDLVEDDEIARLAAQTPPEAIVSLIAAANAAGGGDNITALIIGLDSGIANDDTNQQNLTDGEGSQL